MALSRERIAIEVRGLLGLADPVPVLTIMLANGIFAPVLPELAADRLPVLARTIAAEAAAGIAPDWRRRLAAALPADPAVAEAVAVRLRLSNADRARVTLAATPWDGAAALSGGLGAGGRSGRRPAADRRRGRAGGDGAGAWQRPKLPASGRDVIARGVSAGPDVARRLAAFERAWVAAGFPTDVATVTALLDRAVASA